MSTKEEIKEIQNMTDQQMYEEMILLHAQAAGTAISQLLKTNIEITNPQIQEMTVKEVEYSILEPAIFVKSCLTSNAAGNVISIFRQRDMQAFLNELMGIDELPDPDFEFDEIAMSAVEELMNQMVHSSTAAMAGYLKDEIQSSDCQLVLSDGRENLASVIGESPDSPIMVVHYQMKIKDLMESEFIECISITALESIAHEMEAKREVARKEEAGNQLSPEKEEGAQVQDKTAVHSYVKPLEKEKSPRKSQAHPAISGNLSLIMDVPLSVSVEVGKAKKRLKDVLNFNNGTVVELDKQADAPVDIIVNGQLIARGEVVVIDDNFGVRISEIVNTKSIIGNGE